MKNYKQILEAINKGIKLALDDFEDDELQGQSNSKVNHQHGTKEYLDLMNEVVDLGLPSGTLWCKYNLGVDSNQLSKAEDWYGDYYAWGELEGNKPIFDWDHYRYSYGPYDFYKYVNIKEYAADDNNNKVDNLIELLPEDDAAYQFKKCHNFKFHIPTKEQFEELINYTENYWIINYDPNKLVHNIKDDGGIQGLNGRVFEGLNGNQLFIPTAGFHRVSNQQSDCYIYHVGTDCHLWTSSLCLSSPSEAYTLIIYSDDIDIYTTYRYYGCSVRPIINL